MKLYKKRPVLTPQFDVSKLQKQLRSVIQTHLDQSANFGPLSTNACDSKPQHKSLKVTRNATNWKQLHKWTIKTKFANTFFKLLYNTRKVCFPIGRFVSMSSIYKIMTKFCVVWMKVMKLCGERPVLTFQFDVSTLQKQLRSVIQIHLDHSANLGSLLLNVCVTISHINKF